MADYATPQKKRKIETTNTSSNKADLIFERFYKEYKYFNDFVHAFSQLIRDLNHALLPSVITSCDADSPNRYGRPFSDCECEAVVDTKHPFQFGAFFKKGVDIYKCLLKKQVPEDRISKDVTSSLLMFLLEEEWHEELLKLEDDTYITGETQVMVTLGEHLFRRLCYSKEYIMDKHAKKSDICKCGKCKIQDLHFDDTSIELVVDSDGNMALADPDLEYQGMSAVFNTREADNCDDGDGYIPDMEKVADQDEYTFEDDDEDSLS